MGLLDSVKKSLWESDEPSTQPTAPTARQAFAPAPLGASLPPGASSTTFTAAGPDPEMMKSLQDVITKRPTAYTALLQTAADMADVIPDPNQRILAAFKVLKRPASDVIQAIGIHLTDLDASQASFGATLKNALEAQSGSLRNQATQASAAAESAKTQIAQLQDKIAQLTQAASDSVIKATDLNSQADAAEAKLKNTEAQFAAAVEATKSALSGQQNALKSLLS